MSLPSTRGSAFSPRGERGELLDNPSPEPWTRAGRTACPVQAYFLAAAILLGAAAAARAQSVKDLVEVDGARANVLRGYGIVTGLNGNGDSPKGESARLLRNLLQNLVSPDAAVERIDARNAAAVLVTAELPPFQKKGTRLDVSVTALGDARSLAGGELQLTDLRGPLGRQDPAIYALASGRLVAQGDAKRGNPTAATVPGGAILERELDHAFVQERPIRVGEEILRRKTFKLVLKKPDLTAASQIAAQLNAQSVRGAGGRLDVAAAQDGGAVLVRIPTREEYQRATGSAPEVDYEQEPVRWLDRILNQPVILAAPETAGVVINDATKTVSWTGEVLLRAGSVMVPSPAAGARPTVFHAREGQRLAAFLEAAAPALTEQQMVDVVKALHHAGLLQAELRSR
jgi:flagellar P-ring protein precursor FlgI